MQAEDWYYISPGGDKPFAVIRSKTGKQISIPFPEDLKKPGEYLLVQNVNASHPLYNDLPAPKVKKPQQKISLDEETVTENQFNNSFSARIYGYAGIVNRSVVVIPPVLINDDSTLAELYLKGIPENRLPGLEDINGIINYYRFVPTVDPTEIKKGLSKVINGESDRVVIARGKHPQNGWPAYVVSRVDVKKQAGKVLEDGSIDFKERQFIHEIHKDSIVGDLMPAQSPREGHDLYGEKILPENIVKGPVPGDNLYQDPSDRTILKSKVNGYYKETEKEINVIETLVIDQDIDYETGNIEFFGNIVVKGNVTQGFTVSSFGTLKVEGVVEGSLFSSGDMEISKGILGKSNSKVETRGNLTVNHVQNARVFASGNIHIKEYCFHSEVHSNNEILVSGKKGLVAGGHLIARKSITVDIAGNHEEVMTKLTVGVDHDHNKKIGQKKKEIEQFEERRDKLVSQINTNFTPMMLRNPKVFVPRLEPQKRVAAVKLLKELNKFNTVMKQLENEVAELEHRGPQFDFEPEISVTKEEFPGVKKEFAHHLKKKTAVSEENPDSGESAEG